MSRPRKSGSTAIETDLDNGDKHQKVLVIWMYALIRFKQFDGLIFISFQPEATEQNVEQTPVELSNEEMPTKTRFSGRKKFVDFFDSTTQIIETKVCN